MLRKAVLLLLPFALLAAACGGSATKSSSKTATPRPPATVADRATAEPKTPAGDTASALLDTVNPFQLLGNLSGAPTSAEVDPKLKRALLTGDDLPAGFLAMGNFTFEVPSENGSIQFAANMFASGDIASGQFGAMVMSAAMALPQEAVDELNRSGGLDQLQTLSDADLQQIQGAAEAFGVSFDDLHLLNASGLGDGGMGMHMVMDFGAMLGAFSATDEENPFAEGLAMDMYMFLRGDHAFMVMAMWPGGESSGVDSRGLAEALDDNASGVF